MNTKGTHTLKLEFSRSENYDLNTSLASFYDRTQIEAEFCDDILIEEIRANFNPDDIFTDEQLVEWAEAYGYVRRKYERNKNY